MRLLAQRIAPGSTVLVVGGDGLVSEVEKAGFVVTRSADDAPAAVVQGFAPEVGWTQLAEAAFALKVPEEEGGIPWIATNTDWTIPQARGIAPGNGTLVSAVHTAVGRLATVAGKPEVPIFEEAVARFGARHPLFLGDRLDTDILGANRAGIPSALVLTGIDRPKHVLAAPAGSQPTFILGDLRELHEPYPEVQVRDGVVTVRGARVRIDGPDVRILAEGDRPDRPPARGRDGDLGHRARDLRLPRARAALRGSVPPPVRRRRASGVTARRILRAWIRPRRTDDEQDDLLSTLEVIEAQPLATRAGAYDALHDALARRLEVGRRPAPAARPMTARLDAALAARGLARSRTHAATLIADGLVTVDGRPVVKASTQVADDARIEVAGDRPLRQPRRAQAHRRARRVRRRRRGTARARHGRLDRRLHPGAARARRRPGDRRGCRARPARGIRRRRPRASSRSRASTSAT